MVATLPIDVTTVVMRTTAQRHTVSVQVATTQELTIVAAPIDIIVTCPHLPMAAQAVDRVHLVMFVLVRVSVRWATVLTKDRLTTMVLIFAMVQSVCSVPMVLYLS